ncbi:hypothetical protein UC34_14010 [Pandoraea vervacti]|uniref:Uncharacterized protein n=1 Tax=Pandoraea vervacti TaxID=656178 RepID=A0ABN4FQP8_9BURK|nr:hypothetical protein [Pandoraea vervacti]AJP57795.1 hypothetical protein UC34_14010 [Pandoraea vervacti]
MITSALDALRSAIHPCRHLESSAARLNQSLDVLDDSLRGGSPGASDITEAAETVEKACLKSDGWHALKRGFSPESGRKVFVEQLVRTHLATTDTGLAHVRQTFPYAVLDSEAADVVKALKPTVRDAIVSRWSDPESTAVHMSEPGFIALEVPGTDLRCALFGGCFGSDGLALTQREATQLLLARPEGAPPGATVLRAMRDGTADRSAENYALLSAAIDAYGNVLPELNQEDVRAVANAAHDAFVNTGDTRPREPFAWLFRRMGDTHRADQSLGVVTLTMPANGLRGGASILARTVTNEASNRPSNQASNAAPDSTATTTPRELTLQAQVRAMSQATPRAVVDALLASAKTFEDANDPLAAAGKYALAAEKLAGFALFPSVGEAMFNAFGNYGPYLQRTSRIASLCAEAFEARGLYLSAAATHEVVADYLEASLKHRIDREIMATLAITHRDTADACFVKAGQPAAAKDRDFAGLIRTAIEANSAHLSDGNVLAGDGYVIKFEDQTDPFLAETFDKEAPTEWVLFMSGHRADGVEIYTPITEESWRMLTRPVTDERGVALANQARRHPHLTRPLADRDFARGAICVEMFHRASKVGTTESDVTPASSQSGGGPQ